MIVENTTTVVFVAIIILLRRVFHPVCTIAPKSFLFGIAQFSLLGQKVQLIGLNCIPNGSYFKIYQKLWFHLSEFEQPNSYLLSTIFSTYRLKVLCTNCGFFQTYSHDWLTLRYPRCFCGIHNNYYWSFPMCSVILLIPWFYVRVPNGHPSDHFPWGLTFITT